MTLTDTIVVHYKLIDGSVACGRDYREHPSGYLPRVRYAIGLVTCQACMDSFAFSCAVLNQEDL